MASVSAKSHWDCQRERAERVTYLVGGTRDREHPLGRRQLEIDVLGEAALAESVLSGPNKQPVLLGRRRGRGAGVAARVDGAGIEADFADLLSGLVRLWLGGRRSVGLVRLALGFSLSLSLGLRAVSVIVH